MDLYLVARMITSIRRDNIHRWISRERTLYVLEALNVYRLIDVFGCCDYMRMNTSYETNGNASILCIDSITAFGPRIKSSCSHINTSSYKRFRNSNRKWYLKEGFVSAPNPLWAQNLSIWRRCMMNLPWDFENQSLVALYTRHFWLNSFSVCSGI